MRIVVVLAALALSVALGAPAFAGGWAVTTLDTLPAELRAQVTYPIGYTIRQHGVTPIDVDRMADGWPSGTTEILITSPDGARTLRYAGIRTGATGHYVAQVLFPSGGTWTWQVTQGPFAPQSLGKVEVLPVGGAARDVPVGAPPVAASVVAPATPARPSALVITALLLAAAGAAILVGTRLAALGRRRAAA